jgi:beta-phosphoglucomutase
MVKAFLFDLNGTMVDDMHFHISAWQKMLNKYGCNFSYEQTKKECYGKNEEIFERIFPGKFSVKEGYKLGYEKELQYQKDFKPHLKLINGLDLFLADAYEKNIKLAIGSAAIRANIDFVIDGTDTRKYFEIIISANDVIKSKPHPETYLKCAAALHVQPHECLVFEDSPKGIECATNAGMKSVCLTTMHTQPEFNDENIISFVKDYTHLSITSLI